MALRSTTLFIAFSAVLWTAAVARAQYQVEGQSGQVDTRVNGELYGKNGGMGQLILPQVRLLPSEERYAIWRSGALPSEVEAGRISAGPLTPNGVIDYLPRQSPLQKAMGLPSPQLYNPAYDPALRNGRANGQQAQGVQRGYPQNAREGLAATNRLSARRTTPAPEPKPAVRPPTEPVPGLTPAPEQPLPTGQLFDDVKYDPNATVGSRFIQRVMPKLTLPKALPKPSLADEKKKE
jgi:hypothetical protein